MCMVCRSLFVLFLLAIVLSVLLIYTNYDYPFGIFKHLYYDLHCGHDHMVIEYTSVKSVHIVTKVAVTCLM